MKEINCKSHYRNGMESGILATLLTIIVGIVVGSAIYFVGNTLIDTIAFRSGNALKNAAWSISCPQHYRCVFRGNTVEILPDGDPRVIGAAIPTTTTSDVWSVR